MRFKMKSIIGNKFNKLIILLRERAIFLYLVAKHQDTPMNLRLAVGALLFYIVLPFDIIPDSFFGVGIIDDILVWQLITTYVFNNVPANVKQECWPLAQKQSRFFKKIFYIVLFWIVLMIISLLLMIWSLLR